MQEVQATNNERVFEGMHHVMLGDVFKSVRHPNFTLVEKGNTLTVVSVGGGEAVAEVRNSLGDVLNPAYKLKINHVINGYFEYTGVDMTVINSKYVRKMCSVMGIEYLSIPADVRTTLLNAESKATVNQMLAAYKESQSSTMPLPPALEQAVATANAAVLERTKKDKLQQVEAYRRDAETHYKRYQSYEEQARETMIEYEALDNAPPSGRLLESLRVLLASGWYKLHEVQADRLVFTTPEVIIKHGTYEVNFGQYAVVVRLPSLNVHINRYANTLDVNGFIHPHANSGGGLCMGNAHTAIQRAAEAQDVAKLLGLVKEILTNYNPDSPYVSIGRFIEASNNSQRIGAINTSHSYQSYDTDWYLLSKLDIPKEVLPEGTPLIEYDSDEHGPYATAVYVGIYRKVSANGDTLGYYVKDDAGNMHKVHSRYTISHSEIEDFDEYQATYNSNEQEDEDEGDE